MPIDEVFAQLEALAARQYSEDELGRLKFTIEMLKTRLRESEYRHERIVREMLQVLEKKT